MAANGSETILLAEDEESLRRLSARILEQRGYTVIAAETAIEALQIAVRNGRTIDLLLTDLVMPQLSGTALAERVSAVLPDIRVLFMSGYADDVVSRNGALTPGSAFLEKPFSANDLADEGPRDARRGLEPPPARPRRLHDDEPLAELVRDRLDRARPDHHRPVVLLDLVRFPKRSSDSSKKRIASARSALSNNPLEVLLRLPDVLRNDLGETDHGDACIRARGEQLLELVHL